MNPHKAAVFLLCLAAVCRAGADIVLEPPVFHGAARSALYRENWPEDNGGVVYCFLRNTGASPDRVAELLVNGLAPGEWPKLSWWRVWPESLAPGGTGCLTLKATGDPSQGFHRRTGPGHGLRRSGRRLLPLRNPRAAPRQRASRLS